MALSWLQMFWLLVTLAIAASCVLVVLWPHLSVTLADLVQYGKSPTKKKSSTLQIIAVPKRWFTHFYIIAFVCTTFWSVQLYLLFTGASKMPPSLRQLMLFLIEPNTKPTVDRATGCIVLCLLWLHTVRRLLESLFVSVYSETEMNVLHYLIGCFHYVSLPVCLVAQISGVVSNKIVEQSASQSTFLFSGVALFIYCSYGQHRCLKTFADMRKNYLGNIVNYAHGIPYEGWFQYVSCPHFLFEIGIYVALYVCLGLSHNLWFAVLCFVSCNQLGAALITHRWYKERFGSSYPTERKALIPYLL